MTEILSAWNGAVEASLSSRHGRPVSGDLEHPAQSLSFGLRYIASASSATIEASYGFRVIWRRYHSIVSFNPSSRPI